MIDFNLANDATFEQIQDWFGMHWGELPITLDGAHKYYSHVEKCADVNIESVKADLERNNGKPTRISRLYKSNLIELYNDLKTIENHNKPMNVMEPDKFRM